MTGLVFLAVTSAESQSSKTPFYVAGGLLVLLAISVSALGVRSETFPRSRGQQVGVLALAIVLVVAAMATAVVTA